MKPRCLLIAPTKYFYKNVCPDRVKYYLVTLMSHVLDLAEVEVLDLEVRFGYPQSEAEIETFLGRSEEALKAYQPDVVGVSCYTSYDYLACVDVLRICHRLFPRAVKVVGGYHPTAVPEDFLGEDVPVDYVVRGEGEIVLQRILSGEMPATGAVLDAPALDLDQERPLRWDLYPHRYNDVTLALSRGCPYHCTFCVQSDDFPNRYRRQSLEQIEAKIERLKAHMPLKRIFFIDPYFGVQRQHTMELLTLLVEKYNELNFWAETRIDTVRPEWLGMLSKLKLDLHFGVESLAGDTLNLMQKAKDPEKYVEGFYRTLELCQQQACLGRCGLIMNYPGESPESYRTTLGHLAHAAELYDEVHFTFHCNQYALYPGNRIYHERHELARERGFSFPNDGWWRRREPEVRARSEQCLASAAIAEAYDGDRGFWKKDVLALLKRYSSKYSFKAFTFYQREEILQSLRHHYPEHEFNEWDEETHSQRLGLVRHFRYSMRDLYFRYQRWLAQEWPEVEEEFFRLFNAVTFQYQESLLDQYDDGSDVDHLSHGIDLFYRQLVAEAERNQAASRGKTGPELDLSLLGQVYRLGRGGVVYRLEPTAERGVS